MKTLLIAGLALSLTVQAQTGAGANSQGSGYAPNDGTSKPGNPGTFTSPKAGLGGSAPATSGTGTDINAAETMGTGSSAQSTAIPSGYADPNIEANENLERSNTSANPIPTDTTLQKGKTQTGPYKTPGNKQSQEATEEELDYRAVPNVDHSDSDASENQ